MEELGKARELHKRGQSLSLNESRRLQQLFRQADLLARLLSDSLQTIAQQAAGYRDEKEWQKQFAERYPTVKLNADKPIVDDGDLITTAGLMAWSELGLRLVDRLLGPSIAASTARFLVIEHSDSASQCGSNFAPILGHGDPAILNLLPDLLKQDTAADVATLAAPITSLEQWRDPHCVKVVRDSCGRALYFR